MRRFFIAVCFLVIFAKPADSQGTISTFAGGGPNNVPGTAANINSPRGMVFDAAGNLYIAAENQHRVFKLDSLGQLSVVAGSGLQGFRGDGGPAIEASLSSPSAIALDTGGNLFICEAVNNRIRRVDSATGIISTVAGTGTFAVSGNGGPATAASFGQAFGVAVDGNNNLYVADLGGVRIRRIVPGSDGLVKGAPDEIITTVAGNGVFCAPSTAACGDGGLASAAILAQPIAVAVDAAGDLFIADQTLNRIRRIDSVTGIITTVAGTGLGGFLGDGGLATTARLNGPRGVAVDTAGNIFIADSQNQRIRKVNTSGIISTVAGIGILGFSGDGGPAVAARLAQPNGVAVKGSGDFSIADVSNFRVRLVSTGTISTVVGNGTATFSGDSFPATSASLNSPSHVVADSVGNVYFSEFANSRIRRVDPSGVISTIAGTGSTGFSGDGGLATAAQLNGPAGLLMDGNGNLYVGDVGNARVRRVNLTTGIITTVAGNGTGGFAGDGGPAISAQLNNPQDVAMDAAGTLYVAECNNNRIRRVDGFTGIITTFAGTGASGFGGDFGPATGAMFRCPAGLALDSLGNLYVGDINNSRVRRVETSTGIITTVAGGGLGGDGGPATSALVTNPRGLSFASDGSLLIAAQGDQRIRRVNPGSDGYVTGASDEIISTVAGTGVLGFGGDGGLATSARLATPIDVFAAGAGLAFITDFSNLRVRLIVMDSTPPVITPTVTGTLGNNSWYVGNVDVSWNVTDAESAVSTMTGCGLSNVTSDTSGVTFTCTATSLGGTTSKSVTIQRDATTPQVNCGAADGVWHASDASVACTATDSGAGLAIAADASFSLTTSVAAGTETASAATGSRSVCDDAGNCASAGPYTFKVDKKAPQQSTCDSTDGAWHGSDVTLHCTYTDGGSGPASQQVALATSVASGTETANAAASAGGAQACDAAGNCAASPADITGNKVDKRAPSVTCGAADGVWHASNVSINCTATDGGSGPASQNAALSTGVLAGTETANASTNSTMLCDAVNNCSATGPVSGNRIDRKPPTISISAPAAGSYLLNQLATASYNCSDGGSGSASCSGPVASGNNFDTASVGAKSFTVTATDNAGNATSSTVNYTVTYASGGMCAGSAGHSILQPINADGTSVFKQGSTVPAKFSVCDANDISIGTPGVVAGFNLIQTMSGTVVATVNEPVDSTTPDPNFRWVGSQWIFNISTKPLTKNVTYFYRVTLNDGTTINFNFGLK